MSHEHETHEHPDHRHGPGCGHTAVKHGDHVDYLHEGHMHSPHGDHYDEHAVEVSEVNPDECTGGHACSEHDSAHQHGPDCGHEAVPHGDHVDYLVGDHLHHPHDGHCDNHGKLKTA